MLYVAYDAIADNQATIACHVIESAEGRRGLGGRLAAATFTITPGGHGTLQRFCQQPVREAFSIPRIGLAGPCPVRRPCCPCPLSPRLSGLFAPLFGAFPPRRVPLPDLELQHGHGRITRLDHPGNVVFLGGSSF
jgi:hypothetical protein